MFYSITGKVILIDETTAVLDNNGIAYEILVPRTVLERICETGKTITLFTRQIVREDDIYLVGFLSPEDRRLFETLMTVSGIGPKQGLKILSDMSAGDIRNAIITSNESALSKIKGVGPKTASRIILELKDKIKKLQIADVPHAVSSQDKKKLEALLALRVLGYTDNEARRAIDSVYQNITDIGNKETEDIIKLILAGMGR